MKKLIHCSGKKMAISALIGAVAFGAGKIVFDYAAPPSHPKDCDYIYPGNGDRAVP